MDFGFTIFKCINFTKGYTSHLKSCYENSKFRNKIFSMPQYTLIFLRAEEGDSKLDKYTKKGDGWKRLQLIAQSRVNTDPDKVNQYPSHKFPLKD